MIQWGAAAIAIIFTLCACGATDDSGVVDGSIGDAPIVDAVGAPDAKPARDLLSQVGLYSDIATKTLAPGVVEFEPAHALWTDGAVKTRWIKLPPDTVIDTSDMDHWVFPVGAKLFKEFVRDGVLIETRMIEKTGTGNFDYWVGAFIWQLDESDAAFAPGGRTDVNGTDHDVPDDQTCWTCHIGEADHYLGFSAIQLSHSNPGVTLDSLATAGLLSDPPPDAEIYPAPGDSVTSAALGYLHANCGHCHNPLGQAWPDTDMNLRLHVAARDPVDTMTYQTAVGVMLNRWNDPGYTTRIVSGDAASSAVIARMSARGDSDEMPPVGSEVAHAAGVADVSAWIDGL